MTTELEAILGSDLVAMVFLYGSAAMLIISMIVVTWLCETGHSRAAARTGQTAFVKVAPRRT